jgi:hypothetical protein
MTQQRDRFLTLAMGECWHEYHNGNMLERCKLCKKTFLGTSAAAQIKFDTWDGFGKLWEWANKQDWWGDFLECHGRLMCKCGCCDGEIATHFITPNGVYNFPDAVYEFITRTK